MQDGNVNSIDSELTEMLQVAEVKLKTGDGKVNLNLTDASECPRCRRYTSPEPERLCVRCEDVINNNNKMNGKQISFTLIYLFFFLGGGGGNFRLLKY